MPAAAPSTEVFAFSTPVVKPGNELQIGVVVKAKAPPLVLSGSRSAWLALFEQLQAVFAAPEAINSSHVTGHTSPPANPVPQKTAPESGYHRRAYPYPKAYDRMIAERAAGNRLSWSALARKHGVKACNFFAWNSHRRRHGKTAVDVLDRAPVLKPGGKIL